MPNQLSSNLRLARVHSRRSDIILNRVEELVATYNGMMEDYLRLSTLCDLFFTADYWLKYYATNAQYEAEQASVVMGLYKEIVDGLCAAFQCYVHALPKHLELMFGRTITEGGADVDVAQGIARYAEPGETAQFRLRFKEGKAYQYPWWQGGRWSDGALVLAQSRRAEAKVHGAKMGGEMPNWGNCVMSMNREIYMAKHCLGSKDNKGIYHSFYLPNSAVMFAGSMLVVSGEVIAVCPNSGHFYPTENSTLALLQALTMFAAQVEHIAVYSHRGEFECMAPVFMDNKGVWSTLQDNAARSLQLNKEAAWASRQHPYVQKWVDRRAHEARKRLHPEYYDNQANKPPGDYSQTPYSGRAATANATPQQSSDVSEVDLDDEYELS